VILCPGEQATCSSCVAVALRSNAPRRTNGCLALRVQVSSGVMAGAALARNAALGTDAAPLDESSYDAKKNVRS